METQQAFQILPTREENVSVEMLLISEAICFVSYFCVERDLKGNGHTVITWEAHLYHTIIIKWYTICAP